MRIAPFFYSGICQMLLRQYQNNFRAPKRLILSAIVKNKKHAYIININLQNSKTL